MNTLYKISEVVAVLAGLNLAVPYLKQLAGIIKYNYVDIEQIKLNKYFSLSILCFTFSALMNYIVNRNLGIFLAQLFSAIPLIIVHIYAFFKHRDK